MEPRKPHAVFVPNHQFFASSSRFTGLVVSWLRIFDATLLVLFRVALAGHTPLNSSIFIVDQFGDKICVFGFSRGAYTARALAGMLAKVDIPTIPSTDAPLTSPLGRTSPRRQQGTNPIRLQDVYPRRLTRVGTKFGIQENLLHRRRCRVPRRLVRSRAFTVDVKL